MKWTAPKLVFLLFLFVSIAGTALSDTNSALNGAPASPATAAGAFGSGQPILIQDGSQSIDYRMSEVRLAILVAGFAIFAWGFFLPRHRPSKLARARLFLLAVAAAGAFASYYQFFQFSHVRGFATTDNFHYYVGSKYFEELGYFDLYGCSLAVLAERGLQLPNSQRDRARNLHSMELQPYETIKKDGQDCPERFGDQRWQAFGDDVAFFVQKWPSHLRRATWQDHGYHPSPPWTLAGGWVANIFSVSNPESAYLLSRVDRLLIISAFATVAWIFGLETTCLIVLIWGTGCLWRYAWVGDAFLRHLWWISAIGGVAALKRGLPLIGGAALSCSTLLRLFPGALGLGYGLRAAQHLLAHRELKACHKRFVGGAALAFGGIGLASLIVLPSSAYSDFVIKILEFSSMTITNQIGLQVLAQWLSPQASWVALPIHISILIAFFALFWRALRETEDWEAAALGACLIPLVTAPTNYYFSFFIAVALLASRRPTVGLVLLGAATAWNLNGLIFYQEYDEYRWASVIAVAASFLVVAEVIRGKLSTGLAQGNPDASSTKLRSQAPISG
ncbi:MAG TPA: hypothetical protein EYG06_02070 [Myxococcales bacterium]|nr:hypothetical protein [Myxococcales bacterium]